MQYKIAQFDPEEEEKSVTVSKNNFKIVILKLGV